MWSRSIIDALADAPLHRKKVHAVRQRQTRRLLLEGLEDRRLMAFNVLDAFPAGRTPQDLSLAHIDADSRLDMVLIENNRIAIRLGQADGSFGDPIVPLTEIQATSAATGDFNGDNVTDLVTVDQSRGGLWIGNGDGTFQAPQFFGLPNQIESAITGTGPYWQSPQSVAVGDINADGKLDLAVGGMTSFPSDINCGYYGCGYWYSAGGYVNVLLGNGGGSFDYVDADTGSADPNAFRLGNNNPPTSVAIDDLNNDGKGDVFVAKFYEGLAALLGDGSGGLQGAVHSGSGRSNASVSLGDIDGDGFLDTVTSSGNSLIVQKGQGDGSFAQASGVNTGLRLNSAVIGDVDGDGKLDLVAIGAAPCTYYGYYGGCYDQSDTRQASVLLGDGQGGFALPIVSSLGTVDESPHYPIDLLLADLTGDNLLDLIMTDGSWEGAVVIAANNGQWGAPLELAITDATVVEGNSGSVQAVFTVTLSGEPSGQVTVDFATSDASAFAGADYAAQSGTLTLGPGMLSRTITVPILGDRVGEGDETFFVKLSNPLGALLRDPDGMGSIVDNEPSISIDHGLGINPLTVVEGDSGTTPAVFTVTLSHAYDQEVTVDYYTSTGHTSDIISASGTLRFLPGQTSQTITVAVVYDLIHEALEAFNVYLTNPSPNAAIMNGAGYCYIEDNDPSAPPTISIGDARLVEGNSSTNTMMFTIYLSQSSGQTVQVNYATANNTAKTSDNDYVAKGGTLVFAPGETSKTIQITIKGDTRKEKSEKFFVNLSAAGGGTIADGQGVGTIVDDDSGNQGKVALQIAAAIDAALCDMLAGSKKKGRR